MEFAFRQGIYICDTHVCGAAPSKGAPWRQTVDGVFMKLNAASNLFGLSGAYKQHVYIEQAVF